MVRPLDRRRLIFDCIALTVCGIIVVGLLLPAVRISPGPSRRLQCANNLKQLALATIQFESARKQYPGSQEVFGRFGDADGKLGSWTVSLLPFLEQQLLRDLWDDAQAQTAWEAAATNQPGSQRDAFYPTISSFVCSTDKTLTHVSAPLSYVANCGFYLLDADPALALPVYQEAQTPSQRSTISQRSANGIFANTLPRQVWDPAFGMTIEPFGRTDDPTTSSAVREGLSQTVLFSENHNTLTWSYASAADDSARLRLGMVWLYAGAEAADGRPAPMPLSDRMRINGPRGPNPRSPENSRPASSHSGIVNVAMADGAVITISDKIDYRVYQALLTPQTRQSDMPDNRYLLKEDAYLP